MQWLTRSLVLALLLTGLLATGAQAELQFFTSGDNAPPNNADEEAFFEALLGSTLILDTGGANFDNGLITTTGGEGSGTVEWDLTGTGLSFDWVVVINGGVAGPGTGKLFNVYEVIGGQNVVSNGPQDVLCCHDAVKGISHFQFLGGETTNGVPEPATMLLLGSGLLGGAIAGRRFARRG